MGRVFEAVLNLADVWVEYRGLSQVILYTQVLLRWLSQYWVEYMSVSSIYTLGKILKIWVEYVKPYPIYPNVWLKYEPNPTCPCKLTWIPSDWDLSVVCPVIYRSQ